MRPKTTVRICRGIKSLLAQVRASNVMDAIAQYPAQQRGEVMDALGYLDLVSVLPEQKEPAPDPNQMELKDAIVEQSSSPQETGGDAQAGDGAGGNGQQDQEGVAPPPAVNLGW